MKVILIDHRWNNPGLGEEVARHLSAAGYEPRITQLEVGDVMWGSPLGRVGVEVKTVPDLLESHRTGRLDDQLARLARACAVPVLLIWGPLGIGADVPRGWTWDAVDDMLLGRQLRGIYVARTGDEPLGQRLAALIRYLDRKPAFRPPRPAIPFFTADNYRKAIAFHALLGLVPRMRRRSELADAMAAAHSIADLVEGRVDLAQYGLSKREMRELVEALRR